MGREALVSLGIVLAVLLAFAPAFRAEFVDYDDDLNFVGNERFRGLSGEHVRWMFTTGWMGHYQPLSWVTLGADYVAHGELDGPGFHRTNVFLHALTALLFFFLARRILAAGGAGWRADGPGAGAAAPAGAPANGALEGRPAGALVAAAAVAALLFAVHPLRVESVAWVTERRDVLSGALFVGALLAWIRGPWTGGAGPYGARAIAAAVALAAGSTALLLAAIDLSIPETIAFRPFAPLLLAAASVAWLALIAVVARRGTAGHLLVHGLLLLSLLAKAWGLVMPALLLVLDFWPRRRGRLVDLVVEKLPAAVLAILFATLAAWAQSGLYATMRTLEQHTATERIAQVFHGLAFYPAKTLVPVSLGPFYDLPDHLDPLAPRFLLPAIAVIGVTIALLLTRRRFPALLCAWAAFAIVVAPVLGVLQSGPQLVAERYTYLSCLPFALLAGGGALAGFRSRRTARLATLLAAVVLLLLGALTWRQTTVWTSSEALWRHTLEVRPDHPAGWLHAATSKEREATRASDPDERRALLEESRALLEEGLSRDRDPRLLGALAAIHGELAEAAEGGDRRAGAEAPDLPGAAVHRRAAVRYAGEALRGAIDEGIFRPRFRLAYGLALLEVGRAAEALDHLAWYSRERPDDAEGTIAQGRALRELGRHAEAMEHFERLTAGAPGNVSAWRELGRVREEAGDRTGALQAYQRAITLEPGDAPTRERMRALLAR
jgi:hypothetical protein